MVIPGIGVSDSDKDEALANTLENQFHPLAEPSVPAVIEIYDVALKTYFLTPASEHILTNSDEVHEAIRCLKVGKAPGPNGITNRTLKHLPSWSRSSMQSFSPTLLHPCGSTLLSSLSSTRGRIRHYHHPIDPLVSWT
jgi:hypothetical protein